MTTDPNPSPPPPPRAFAQGTGVLLQTAGMTLFLSTCCVCSLTGLWDPPLSRPDVMEYIRNRPALGVTIQDLLQQPAKAGLMLMVMLMTASGLAIAGFGLGMQTDRPRAAEGALVTLALSLAVLMLAGVGIWVGDASWVARLWHAVLTLLILVLGGFTWTAFKEIKANPPPPGWNKYEPDDIEDP